MGVAAHPLYIYSRPLVSGLGLGVPPFRLGLGLLTIRLSYGDHQVEFMLGGLLFHGRGAGVQLSRFGTGLVFSGSNLRLELSGFGLELFGDRGELSAKLQAVITGGMESDYAGTVATTDMVVWILSEAAEAAQ